MEGSKTIQSLERALDVLELIAERKEIGVSEIAQEIGLHIATVHNILRTLVARGYLMKSKRRYQLGIATTVLHARSDATTVLTAMIQPELEIIAQITGEGASATVMVGPKAQVLAYQPGTEAITVQHPKWQWDHPLTLAAGQLLIAFESDSVIERVVARHMEQNGGTAEGEWAARFGIIRQAEFAELLPSERDPQYAVAALVRTKDGAPLAAIGTACPEFRADDQHRLSMREAVREACLNVSRKLRF